MRSFNFFAFRFLVQDRHSSEYTAWAGPMFVPHPMHGTEPL